MCSIRIPLELSEWMKQNQLIYCRFSMKQINVSNVISHLCLQLNENVTETCSVGNSCYSLLLTSTVDVNSSKILFIYNFYMCCN